VSATRRLETLVDRQAFLEAPRWRDSRLYVSDFFTHEVSEIDLDGARRTVCTVPGQPSGLGFLDDGTMLVVSMHDRAVLRVGGDGSMTVYADLSEMVPAHANDMVVHRNHAYVGNFGAEPGEGIEIPPTVLVRIGPDGVPTIAADGLVFPNGAVISPDGSTLIVAESFAYCLSAFEIESDGTLGARREWATFAPRPESVTFDGAFLSGNVLPDGIAVDMEGAIWVADAGGGGAIRVLEGGEITDRIQPGDNVFALALGGDDGHTLFMCVAPPLTRYRPWEGERAARILTCQVDVPAVLA
jgi:sugar lactone lactonase YvrE